MAGTKTSQRKHENFYPTDVAPVIAWDMPRDNFPYSSVLCRPKRTVQAGTESDSLASTSNAGDDRGQAAANGLSPA